MNISRRAMIASGGAALLGGFVLFGGQRSSHAQEGKFEIQLSDAQWKKRLTPEQYAVLREADTERAGSSPLNQEKRKGVYACAGCGPLSSSATTFESGPGWPRSIGRA